MRANPSGIGSPVYGPLSTRRSVVALDTYASGSGASSASSGAAMTRVMGSPNRRANAKSRSSWAGTAMMAPVP